MSEHHHHHSAPADPSTIDTARQAICLVTGDTVDKQAAELAGHITDYNGQTYYLCCATCVQLFNKSPEKYASKQSITTILKLTEKEQLADNVWAFRFFPNRPLTWTPGQFIRVELMHEHPDAEGTQRWFTVSSTPDDSFVQITTRVTRTSFKKALAVLPIGGELRLVNQPDGDFVWADSDKPLVFVAGGIGITPYYSILKARGHSGQPVTATLIYNGRDANLPFRQEFDEAVKRHPEFRVKYVIGKQLNASILNELVPDLNDSLVYISGPEPMVDALGRQLKANGFPEAQLKQDFFPNYNEDNY